MPDLTPCKKFKSTLLCLFCNSKFHRKAELYYYPGLQAVGRTILHCGVRQYAPATVCSSH